MASGVRMNEDLTRAVERVQQNGERMPIRRNGRVIAALVPADDLKVLEEMDRQDRRAARRALARAKARGEKPVPWSEVRKRLKL